MQLLIFRFGYKNFGRLLAVYSTVSSATQFAQPPLLALTLGPFHGNYAYTNLIFFFIWIPMFLYPVVLYRKSRVSKPTTILQAEEENKE
jgi:hypothetical protein